MLPKVRPELTSTSVGDELLVYCPRTEMAHCLSPTVSRVYEACSAGSTRAELAGKLSEPALESALLMLQGKNLLADPIDSGRRHFLAQAVTGLAIASVGLPRAAAAASCACTACDAATTCGCPCDDFADCTKRCAGAGGSYNGDPLDSCCQDSPFSGDFCILSTDVFNPDCNTARTMVGPGETYFCCECGC
ncbi:MAG: hypothetical protein KC910_06980 [Candidatus Eremiobacteraeota bacterium]|nr:hypothetical protein [Candidatus Eremiobacteraeota bacterium]